MSPADREPRPAVRKSTCYSSTTQSPRPWPPRPASPASTVDGRHFEPQPPERRCQL